MLYYQKTQLCILGLFFLISSCGNDNNPSQVESNILSSSKEPISSSSSSIPASSSSSISDYYSSSLATSSSSSSIETNSNALIINHNHISLESIPESWIEKAIDSLQIAYGHTSHGSQLLAGMRYLENTNGAPYLYGNTAGIQIASKPFEGPADFDLGKPDRTSWEEATRKYLDIYPEVNVVMWAWCIGVTTATSEDINTYLNLMDSLEKDYPHVQFVYMTGHLDGTGPNGNLHLRNEQIRDFVIKNNKILYDFADIESFNPDGQSYLEHFANDNCDYYAVQEDGSKGSILGNWCVEWQEANPGKWFECPTAHSKALNGNLKAYAAWYLWARLAGWNGK